MTAQILRPYQQRSFDLLRAGFLAGHRRQVLVLPTGGGKTTVAAYMVRSAVERTPEPNAVLFMAHRKELIAQCSKRLDQNGILAHGVIMASHGRRRPFAPVQVGSVDTLRNRDLLNPPPKLIIADECHRSLGASQNKILLEAYPNARVVGLTATPWRLDCKGLGQYVDGAPTLFSNMVTGATYAELMTDGFILDPVVCCPWSPDLSGVAVNQKGEYDADELAAICDTPQTTADIVRRWEDLANGARTVVFAASIENSHHIVAAFNAAGVKAEHLDGETDTDLRDAILKRLESGETTVVSNFNVLGEGWDCPACEVCILNRPTTSLALYMQMVGRVLRTSPGKTRALVLDVSGCVLRHGWPTADRQWTLEDRPRKGRRPGGKDECDVPPVGFCPQCLFARPTSVIKKACPQCGFVPEDIGRPVDLVTESGVPLVAVTRADVEAVSKAPQTVSWTRRTFANGPSYGSVTYGNRR